LRKFKRKKGGFKKTKKKDRGVEEIDELKSIQNVIVILIEIFILKTTMYYSGHGILANIFLTFLKKNDVNQSLVSLINDNY
jgi:hypothetical protein